MTIPKMEEREEAARLFRAYVMARHEWKSYRELVVNDFDRIVYCGKTGAPVLVSDDIVEDPETGETYISAALGLAPRENEETDA